MNFLTIKIPCTEEPGRLQFMGLKRVRHDWPHTHTHTHTARKTHPFKVYNSVVFNMFTRLCNHHHPLISEHSHHPQKKPPIISSHSPSSLPQALAITNLPVSSLWVYLSWTSHMNGIWEYEWNEWNMNGWMESYNTKSYASDSST